MKEPRNTNEVVVESIIQATLYLMRNKSLDDISITDIVRHAGVSRNSFYRNFKDKEDILRHYITKETECWQEEIHKKHTPMFDSGEFIPLLLEHLYDYRDYIDYLMRDRKMYLLEEEFDYRLKKRLGAESDPWHIAFIVGGLYNLFLYWAETGYQKTPQEIAAYVKF